MKIKVVTLKGWCNKNITPLAWQRIVMKALPQFRDLGFELEELEEPNESRYFEDAEFKVFAETLNTIYNITFPKEVLDKIQ